MIQGIVIRGTTPTHDFELPYPANLIADIRITYGQNNKSIFTKTKDDCKITEGKISVSLIQEETFLFVPNKKLDIEIRIQFVDGQVVQNEEPITLKVVGCMNEEVMD